MQLSFSNKGIPPPENGRMSPEKRDHFLMERIVFQASFCREYMIAQWSTSTVIRHLRQLQEPSKYLSSIIIDVENGPKRNHLLFSATYHPVSGSSLLPAAQPLPPWACHSATGAGSRAGRGATTAPRVALDTKATAMAMADASMRNSRDGDGTITS